MSRRIVVDTSVARAAGTTEHPTSARSREFLQAMLRICHRVVMTPEITSEWRAHQSNFAISWLAAMRRRRKVVNVVPDSRQEQDLVSAVLGSELTVNQRSAVEKDCLLIGAAWATDGLVASNDDRVRKLLSQLAATRSDLGQVVWVNPTAPAETPIEWLAAGARRDTSRQLGAGDP